MAGSLVPAATVSEAMAEETKTDPKEDKLKEFDKHLINLQTRCMPGVEVIQPNRVGSYPFL